MESQEQPFTQSFGRRNRVLRLTFSYEGSNIKLISQQKVEMVLPQSDALEYPEEAQAGFWYELRDSENRKLYRRVIENPIQVDAEVFSDNPELSISRQPVSLPRGSFTILVPDLDQGQTLALYSSPLDTEAAFTPARQIMQFNLKSNLEDREIPQ